MLLSFGSAVNSLVLFFLRDIFTAKAARPPVEAVPATINATVDKQNGHIVLTFIGSNFTHRGFCEFLP
jgi:hypothetical protein